MAIVKDWMSEAADEFASFFSFGSGRDSYVTDEQRQNVADNYRAIIAKHCPLKDGVAYMPVPRCETCGYWKEARSGIGWCGVKREKIQTTPGANLVTSANFGCTEWKVKI